MMYMYKSSTLRPCLVRTCSSLVPQHSKAFRCHSLNDNIQYFRPHRASERYHAEQLVNRYFKEVWNSCEVDVLEEISSPALIMTDRCWWDEVYRGKDRCVRVIREYLTGFQAMHFIIDHLLAAEDGSIAMAHWRASAYHLGSFVGRPGNGNVLEITGMTSFQFAQRKISRIDTFRESLTPDRTGVGIDPYAF